MRPQRFAADHAPTGASDAATHRASMRPQRFAADHLVTGLRASYPPKCFNEAAAIRCGSPQSSFAITSRTACFNEAAAIRCGSPAALPRQAAPCCASMRPQRFAADHLSTKSACCGTWDCFNEAAAIRCGSPDKRERSMLDTFGFNEAAAIRCGSPKGTATMRTQIDASMRPQRFAADHLVVAHQVRSLNHPLQ